MFEAFLCGLLSARSHGRAGSGRPLSAAVAPSARVWGTGPEVWRGMAISPEDLARDKVEIEKFLDAYEAQEWAEVLRLESAVLPIADRYARADIQHSTHEAVLCFWSTLTDTRQAGASEQGD